MSGVAVGGFSCNLEVEGALLHRYEFWLLWRLLMEERASTQSPRYAGKN
jgi:hypothetical protein